GPRAVDLLPGADLPDGQGQVPGARPKPGHQVLAGPFDVVRLDPAVGLPAPHVQLDAEVRMEQVDPERGGGGPVDGPGELGDRRDRALDPPRSPSPDQPDQPAVPLPGGGGPAQPGAVAASGLERAQPG